jgi:hypothetical protein
MWRNLRKDFVDKLVAYGYSVSNYQDTDKVISVKGEDYQFEVIFRFSNYSEKTGYSFTFHKEDFSDGNIRFYVFALVDPDRLRYIIINHDDFKQLMKKPMNSPTYKNNGSYTFNFGRSNPDKLGKWNKFVNGVDVFERYFNKDVPVLVSRSMLVAMKRQLQMLQHELDNLLRE